MITVWLYLTVGLVTGLAVLAIFLHLPPPEQVKVTGQLNGMGVPLPAMLAGAVLLWPAVAVAYAEWVRQGLRRRR